MPTHSLSALYGSKTLEGVGEPSDEESIGIKDRRMKGTLRWRQDIRECVARSPSKGGHLV